MTDPDFTIGEQRRAMRQAAVEAPDDPARVAALKGMLTRPGVDADQRIDAFDLLYAHDPEDARTTLRFRFPSLTSPGLIAYACTLVADRQWIEFTPSLVRLLVRRTGNVIDPDLPEYQALLRLHPDQEMTEIVFDVVATPTGSALMERWRSSAWGLLGRLGSTRSLYALLERQDLAGDPFLADIRAAAVELGVIPLTKEEIKWIKALRSESYSQWWSRCRAAAQLVPAQHRADMRVRHLAVLVLVHEHYPDWVTRSRQDLYAELEARLGSRKHVQTGDSPDPALASTRPQTLVHWDSRLTWPDLLTIHLADAVIHDSTLVRSLFEQADRDRGDESTEYGGIVDIVDAMPIAQLFTPRIRGSDMKFRTPKAMLLRGYTAPFHYHLHVQSVSNGRYAGPGMGDLDYAEAMGVNGLVITSVGRGRLNVDYYLPGRMVVDLGIIDAPAQ